VAGNKLYLRLSNGSASCMSDRIAERMLEDVELKVNKINIEYKLPFGAALPVV